MDGATHPEQNFLGFLLLLASRQQQLLQIHCWRDANRSGKMKIFIICPFTV
jgi:hypothetical protein